MDQLIEHSSSPLHHDLYVVLSRGKLQLCTNEAVYSFDERYDNFRLTFEALPMDQLPLQHILCLGLGLGSIPLLLNTYADHIDEMTAVEIDAEVIRLASHYTLGQIKYPIRVVMADAYTFVEMCDEKYDLILSDLFISDVIPDQFLSQDFLFGLKRILNNEGLIIMNTLATTQMDKANSIRFFEEVFLRVFPEGRLMKKWQNHMLLSY